jgi:type II secretory pathway predicted ATPase ExeA
MSVPRFTVSQTDRTIASRELRAEFVLAQTDSAPRRLRHEVLTQLLRELARLETSRKRQVLTFVERMRSAYPELRESR